MGLVDYFKRLLNNPLPWYFSYSAVDDNEAQETEDIELGLASNITAQSTVTVQFTTEDLIVDSLTTNNLPPLDASGHELTPLTTDPITTNQSQTSDTLSGYQTLTQ